MHTKLAELLSDPSIDQVFALVKSDFETVNQRILSDLQSDIPLVVEVAKYIIGAGGKRLRPLVVLLAAAVCHYSGQNHIKLATLVEYLHTATLLHDDVVDVSTRRRGKQTVNVVWGNAPSVLVGDFLYSRAFQLMVDVRSMPMLEIICDATNVIAEGEVLQLQHIGNADLTETEYLEVIRYKTATLFQASAHAAGALAGANQTTQYALREFGLHLGMAFQLIDDWLDFVGDDVEMGKNVGDDLTEGKATLPLIHTLQHGTIKNKEIVRQAILQRSSESLSEVMQAVQATGSLEYCHKMAQKHTTLCIESLVSLPPNPFRFGLEALANVTVCRMH